MRTPANLVWRAIVCASLALALLPPGLAASPATQMPDRQTLAQAAEDGEDSEPPSMSPQPEAVPEPEPTPVQQEPAEVPQAEPANPLRLGETRRIDPFDANDARPVPRPGPAATANPDHDVVTCEAGCDGAPGAVVYKQKKQPAG
jgi:hypothetical protein